MKPLLFLLLLPFNGHAQQYYNDRDSIAHTEYARREKVLAATPGLPDSVKEELLSTSYLELYNLCHEHRGGAGCWWENPARSDSFFCDKIRNYLIRK